MSEEGKGSGTTQEAKLGFEPKTDYVPGYPAGELEGDREDYLLTQISDLSLASRKTLGNFLSEMSKGNLPNSPSSNAFTLEQGSSDTQLYDRSTGLPVPLVTEGKNSPSKTVSEYETAGATLGSFIDLVEGYDPDAASKFKSTTLGDYGTAKNPFNVQDESGEILYDKNSRKGGHTLLPNIKPIGSTKEVGNAVVDELPPDAPSVQKRISNVLLYNRFNPRQGQSPFISNFEKTGGRFGFSVQKELGKYNSDTASAPDVSINDLKKIAASLMIRSTGHGGGDPDGISMDSVVLPSGLQLGLSKQNMVDLRAQNAHGAEKITKERSELLSNSTSGGFSESSFGSLNSHLEPFNGPMPMGMLAHAVAGIIGLLAFSSLVNLITAGFWSDEGEEDPVDLDPSQMSKGFHRKDSIGGDIGEMFGIPKIDHHFSNCMLYGIMSFCGFNFDPTTSGPQKILDAALNISMAPGYYAVIFRAIIRDVEQITSSVTDLITKLPTLGITGGISSVFQIIEAITTSTTWRFLMVMVNIGNQVLNYRHGHPRLENVDVDSLPVSPTTRIMKSRVQGGANESNGLRPRSLAWAHRANVSRYILPESLDSAYKAVGLSVFGSSVVEAQLAGKVAQGNGKHVEKDKDGKGDIHMKFDGADSEKSLPSRLSSEYVSYVEDALDSEYMPFYFHDLRTNEIISFHAFLNSLSDSFSPEYTKVSGYGRMDSVKIYNKTERSIGFDFTVVATSEEDFDRMWWDINKLVTMVYPQWSRGRARAQGDAGFIQPFSQIPTASPVIRIRFGDLIKSNYSKFNLARLFGVGTTAWKVSSDDNHQQEVAEWLKKSKKAKKKATAYKSNAENEPLDPKAGGGPAGEFSATMPTGGGGMATFGGAAAFPEIGYAKGDFVLCKPGLKEYVREADGSRIKSTPHRRKLKTQQLLLKVTGFKWHSRKRKITKSERQKWGLGNKPIKTRRRKIKYICELTDPNGMAWLPKQYGTNYKHLTLYHDEILGLDPSQVDQIWSTEMGSDASGPGPSDGPETNPSEVLKKTIDFFKPENNFVVKAFESTRGRGMAGVITALSFDWGEATWDITPGRRAPQWLKVSITFDPIHDLPLGLDYDGAMRAPAYNVGKAVNPIGGDPYYTQYSKKSNRNVTYYSEQSKKPGEDVDGPETKDKGEGGIGIGF